MMPDYPPKAATDPVWKMGDAWCTIIISFGRSIWHCKAEGDVLIPSWTLQHWKNNHHFFTTGPNKSPFPISLPCWELDNISPMEGKRWEKHVFLATFKRDMLVACKVYPNKSVVWLLPWSFFKSCALQKVQPPLKFNMTPWKMIVGRQGFPWFGNFSGVTVC